MRSRHLRFLRAGTFLTVTVFFISCSTVFNPATSFQPRTVVFSILHSYDSTQYVRVYENYSVENFNLSTHKEDPQVRDASVSITRSGSPPVVFTDTLFKRISTDKYTDSIVAYYSRSVNFNLETDYHLSVHNPRLGEVHADLTTPGAGIIEVLSGFLIRNPDQAVPGEHISVRLLLPSISSGGFLLKMFVEFQIDSLSQTVQRRWEVPVEITSDGENIYPELKENSRAYHANSESFGVEAYQKTRGDILSKYAAYNPKLLRVSFDLYQFDVNLYNYYNLVNGFRDPFTLRSDLPNYTNIVGGLGVFGAITFSSQKEALP